MDNKDVSLTPTKLIILGEFEFLGGCIRINILVKNTSDLSIHDATLELKSDENILHFIRCEPEYPENKGKIKLGNIDPGTGRTIAFYLDTLVCKNVGTDITGYVNFKDPFETSYSVQMETLKIMVVSPILHTGQEINIERLKELTEELHFKDSLVYLFPVGMDLQDILITSRNAIQRHGMKHITTFKTMDERTYESWYYGKTSIRNNDILVKCAIRRVTKSIEIQSSGNDSGEITGLFSQIGHDLIKEFENIGKIQPVFNLHIKDYVIQRSDLLSLCDIDGNCSGDILIENSVVVQRSNVASKNNGKKDQNEKLEEQNILREEEQQKKIRGMGGKQDDKDPLERKEQTQSGKKIGEDEGEHGFREGQERLHPEEEVKAQDREDQEHKSIQKEWHEKDDADMIEIIPEKSRQRINVKTTIIYKIQELSHSGYQEERGVNFEGVGVDKLVGSLTYTCKKILYMVDDFPVENGRLLYLASDMVGENSYFLLTAVIREYKGLTQALLRVNSDKNSDVNGFLNDIMDNMRHTVKSISVGEIGIISKEQVTIIIDSVVHSVEEERARRKREEQERLHREEEANTREKEKHEHRQRQKGKGENELNKKKEHKEAKITDKVNQAQERKTKVDLSAIGKKEGLLWIMFFVVVVMSCFLVVEYWALAHFANDTNQSLRTSTTLPGSFTNFDSIEFVLIPAGEFYMGSPTNEANRAKNEGPVHQVKIPNAFYMGKCEVTQKQWRKVMGNNPSTFKGDDLPVEQVSWNDVQEFIKKLNENEHVNKYRLPTEAQWEYAARAQTSMMYSFGDNGSKLGDYAWYIGNSGGITHKVGLKKPNPFGLFDMEGNVYEWVQDSYYDTYKVVLKDGSLGEYVSSSRVFRGGSWISNAASCRPANREDNEPGNHASNLGFRIVRDL